MKKILILIAVSIFSVFAVFSEESFTQKIYSVDSKVYKNIARLYVLEGRALANSTGPWSNAELVHMFRTLKGDYENKGIQSLYEETKIMLKENPRKKIEDDFFVNYRFKLMPEFYIQSNPENFNTADYWDYDYLKRKDIFVASEEIFISDYFYEITDVGLGYATRENDPVLYGKYFQSNIPVILGTGTGMEQMSLNFPNRVFFACGGKNWTVTCGRDSYRWGSGETGNLLLGGNFKYDNAARFTVFSDKVKFTSAMMFYPHASEVEKASTDQNSTSMNGFNVLFTHRYDVRFLNDKMSFSLSEALMYQTQSGTMDLRIYNPFSVYHNYYTRGNTNSLLGLDLDWTVIPGLNFYTQYVLDEASAFGEPEGKNGEPWRVSKYGYLGGAKYVLPLEDSVLKFSLEGVYTDPCLYLREKYNSETGQFGVSFYGNYREFVNDKGIQFLRECTGYRYGGDAMVLDFKTEYQKFSLFNLKAELFYMAHGIMKNDLTEDTILGKKNKTPSTEDQSRGAENGDNPSGEVEKIFRVSVSGDTDILPFMKIDGGMDSYFVWNKGNKKEKLLVNFQFHTGVEFTF